MQYGEWIGRIALALIFLFNGFGIVDQSRAAQELAAHGTSTALVPLLIIAGRVLQIAAGIALVVGWHERVAAIFGGLCFVAFRSIPSSPSHIAEIHAPASR
jgi:putative oxidoreductase